MTPRESRGPHNPDRSRPPEARYALCSSRDWSAAPGFGGVPATPFDIPAGAGLKPA